MAPQTARAEPPAPKTNLHGFQAGQGFREGLLVFAVAFAALLAIYVVRIMIHSTPFGQLGNPDLFEYREMARLLLHGRGFSNDIFGLRPPLYPLIIAGMRALTGDQPYLLLLLVHLPLGALTAVWAYKLGYRLVGRRDVAVLAGLLAGLEAAHLHSTVTLMSEPLHNCLLYAGLYCFVTGVQKERVWRMVGAGLLLGLAMLTRAITVYLPIALAGVAIVYRRRLWREALALLLVAATFYLGWSYRNWFYAGNFNISLVGSYDLLFYKTVSVESHATNRDPRDVAAEIALEVEHRLGNVDVTLEDVYDQAVGSPQNLYATDPRRLEVWDQMVWERLIRYPIWFGISVTYYLVKLFDVNEALLLSVWVQRAITVLELLLAALGGWTAGKARQWLPLLLGAIVIGYYAVIPAVTIAGLHHSRFRTPFMPLVLIFSAWGVFALRDRLTASQSGPALRA